MNLRVGAGFLAVGFFAVGFFAGGFFAVLVLFVFLREIRVTLLIAASIPMSLIITVTVPVGSEASTTPYESSLVGPPSDTNVVPPVSTSNRPRFR